MASLSETDMFPLIDYLLYSPFWVGGAPKTGPTFSGPATTALFDVLRSAFHSHSTHPSNRSDIPFNDTYVSSLTFGPLAPYLGEIAPTNYHSHSRIASHCLRT